LKRSASVNLPSPWDEISKYLSAYSNFDGGYLIISATNPTPGNPSQLDRGWISR
jgi:hypothetical protein